MEESAPVPPDPECNWGALPMEPCRYCHQQGGVQFLIDSTDWGKTHPQVVQCVLCGNTWEAETSKV